MFLVVIEKNRYAQVLKRYRITQMCRQAGRLEA